MVGRRGRHFGARAQERVQTLAQWLNRAGEHAARWHTARFRNLTFDLIQMGELYAKVKAAEKARWLWLAIDPVRKTLPALHLGGRQAVDAYHLVHDLTVTAPRTWLWASLTISGRLRRFYGPLWHDLTLPTLHPPQHSLLRVFLRGQRITHTSAGDHHLQLRSKVCNCMARFIFVEVLRSLMTFFESTGLNDHFLSIGVSYTM